MLQFSDFFFFFLSPFKILPASSFFPFFSHSFMCHVIYWDPTCISCHMTPGIYLDFVISHQCYLQYVCNSSVCSVFFYHQKSSKNWNSAFLSYKHWSTCLDDSVSVTTEWTRWCALACVLVCLVPKFKCMTSVFLWVFQFQNYAQWCGWILNSVILVW